MQQSMPANRFFMDHRRSGRLPFRNALSNGFPLATDACGMSLVWQIRR